MQFSCVLNFKMQIYSKYPSNPYFRLEKSVETFPLRIMIWDKKYESVTDEKFKSRYGKRRVTPYELHAFYSILVLFYCYFYLTSLLQNQHLVHYRHACCYLEHHLVVRHSYQDQPVHHLEHRSEHTFQHWQLGMQYSVLPLQNQ